MARRHDMESIKTPRASWKLDVLETVLKRKLKLRRRIRDSPQYHEHKKKDALKVTAHRTRIAMSRTIIPYDAHRDLELASLRTLLALHI